MDQFTDKEKSAINKARLKYPDAAMHDPFFDMETGKPLPAFDVPPPRRPLKPWRDGLASDSRNLDPMNISDTHSGITHTGNPSEPPYTVLEAEMQRRGLIHGGRIKSRTRTRKTPKRKRRKPKRKTKANKRRKRTRTRRR